MKTNFELEWDLGRIYWFAQIISDCLWFQIQTREEILEILNTKDAEQNIFVWDLFNLVSNSDVIDNNIGKCKLTIGKYASEEIIKKFNLIIKFLTSSNEEKKAFLWVCLSDFLGCSEFLNYTIKVLIENLTNVELLEIFNYKEGIPRQNSIKLKIILEDLTKKWKFDVLQIKTVLDNLNNNLAIAERKVIKIRQEQDMYKLICPHPEGEVMCSKIEIIEGVWSYEVRICWICWEKF